MPKRTFLDSSALIASFCGRDEIFQRALAVINDPDREFVSSEIVELEVLGKPTFHKQVEALEWYQEYFSGVVGMERGRVQSVPEALSLAKQFGMSGFDALLVASAAAQQAEEFVTNERPTKPFFRVQVPGITFTSISVPTTADVVPPALAQQGNERQ